MLSAASAVAGFVSVFASDFGGPAHFLAGVGDRAVGVSLGVLLALVCAIPALRLATAEPPAPEPASPPPVAQRVLAGVALVALLAWPLFGPGSGGRFEPLPWLLHGPAWLVVAGGALALALYLRGIGRGAAAVVALATAGTVAILLGLTRGLHGFATVSIDEVAGGLMFAISSGYAALGGLAVVGLPLLDRERGQAERRGGRGGTPGRARLPPGGAAAARLHGPARHGADGEAGRVGDRTRNVSSCRRSAHRTLPSAATIASLMNTILTARASIRDRGRRRGGPTSPSAPPGGVPLAPPPGTRGYESRSACSAARCASVSVVSWRSSGSGWSQPMASGACGPTSNLRYWTDETRVSPTCRSS